MWILLRWPFKFPSWLLRYWHKWQANGFSPVWILKWVFKLWILLKRKSQKWQAWGFKFDMELTFWYWNNIGILNKLIRLIGSIKISLHSINLIEERSKWWFITIIVFGMVLFYHEYFEYEISNLTNDLHCNHTNDRETVFHRCESSNVRSSCPIARPWSCTYCRRRVFPYAETISHFFFKHTFNISVSGTGMNFMNIKICQTVAGIIMMGQFPRIFPNYQKDVN